MDGQLSFFSEAGQSPGLPEEFLAYRPAFLNEAKASQLLTSLRDTVNWRQRRVKMYEKEVLTPRLTAWFGDPDIWGVIGDEHHPPDLWTDELAALRELVEPFAGISFNSVLLNFYRDGRDSVAWHSDNETVMGSHPVIASLSLGQVRTFDIRRKADHQQKYSIRLESGSLLIMKSGLQEQWEHRIAKSTRIMGPRINLTFRQVRGTGGYGL
ncbi:alpha-ketoglutarate-dependent dioxygenase AlkB [Pedobacter sp. SYP-B3415]|uniref:alpha-ketoglutarate-dependent dioxygenase AlkB family protein n=1 Tax=Pedobacter sp. SYP-B3415 TaxID=2496641 RepID=UPI00101BBBC4|nr:alpha-ketoglutarate-dependent dioxygenase AlkB [Pedobacter sp. SYP-B3415]